MWADAQRDGRTADYRWRPLFNAANFGWRPLLEWSAVTLPRRETRWNQMGCSKLTKRSQPLVRWCADADFLATFCILYFQRAACSTFQNQTYILNSH